VAASTRTRLADRAWGSVAGATVRMGSALRAATAAYHDGEVWPRPAHSTVSIALLALCGMTLRDALRSTAWRAYASCWPRTRGSWRDVILALREGWHEVRWVRLSGSLRAS